METQAKGPKLFAGRANPSLAGAIARELGIPLGLMEVSNFSDGEIQVKIEENVRGEDVFIIQSTNAPAENLLELLIILDACTRASARRVTAVIPYFGYARQDRKDRPRVPITAKLAANLITAAGADRVVTMDLHSGQIQGFFDIPMDHLFAAPVLINWLLTKEVPDLVVVAPDVGGVKMARAYAKRLSAGLVIVDKRRIAPNHAEAMHVIGEIEGKNVAIVDDMVDTAGTLTEAARALEKNGAREIFAICTHGILSGEALTRVAESPIRELVVTDTVPLHVERPAKVTVLSIAHLLAKAILCIHKEESVSSLFKF